MPLSAGTRLGPHEILGPLGAGGMGEVYRATDTRLKRQLLAEEKAMKAPIKMLFPTVAFIFPAMFIVILGPAFLNLAKIFKFH